MKKRLEKISILTIIIFMLLNALFPIKIYAKIGDSHNVTEDYFTNWKVVKDNAGVFGSPGIFTVDGQVAWCLEPTKKAITGVNHEIAFSDLGISSSQEHDLALIANFGYYADKNDDNRIKTGNLIWNYLGFSDHYIKKDGSWTTAQQNAWNADIMAKVNAYKQGPSFSGISVTVSVGETITLTDTNDALSSMQVFSNDGLNATINGNTLSITGTIDAKDESTVTLKKPVSNESTVNFVVRNGNSQSLSVCQTKDPLIANIYVKVNKFGSLQLTKQDNKGNYVPNTGFKLAYNEDMTDAIGTYTTLSNGKILVNDLLPTNK